MQRILNDLSISNRQLLIAMLIVLGMLLLSLLVGLFICLAINEDGKALGVKDRKIYAVLGFFFPLITAIVYLIIRKKTEKIQPKMCNNCGLTVPPSINCCPQCGCMDFTDYLIVDNNKHKKRAKCFAVIGVVLYVIMLSFGTLSQFENLLSISKEYSVITPSFFASFKLSMFLSTAIIFQILTVIKYITMITIINTNMTTMII